MTVPAARAAAAALAAAALLPWPALADGLAEAERDVARLEGRLRALEVGAAARDESATARAARRFSEGETQYLLGDWRAAAILLSEAVEDPGFQAGPDHATARFQLADALRRQGACGAARIHYAAYLALPAAPARGEALAGALECAVKDRRDDLVEPLLAEADRIFGDALPAQIRYLAAKALYHRPGLSPETRATRVFDAFAQVPAPYLQQAAYFQGVLRLDAGDLAGAAERFEACDRAPASDARQREVRELCALALGRVHAERGDAAEALRWYRRVPRESARFEEAVYELAWAHVRAGEYDAALRATALVADLSPDSPAAPEATILQGHLLLRLGRYAEATEAYSRVINRYAPVRDELDAILSLRDDPVRYLDELIGRQGKAFDVASFLPAVAVRWATSRDEVAAALELVSALEAGRRDLAESEASADRLDAALARGGLDAFPALQVAYAAASALANDAAVLEGRAATAAVEAAKPRLPAAARAELDRVHGERRWLEPSLSALPRTAEEATARLRRLRERFDPVAADVFRLRYEVDAAAAAVGGTERWLEDHRGEIAADPEGREEVTRELRTHAAAVARYDAEVRALVRDVAVARDGAGASSGLEEEVRLRTRYAALVARERELVSRAGLAGAERARVDRAAALLDRLALARRRARGVADALTREAGRRAEALRGRVAAERRAVAEHRAALDEVQAEARERVGRIALRSLGEVRTQFYQLVLKADVGLVDVAWARKRVRLDKIQELARQKSVELRQLDDDYRDLLREVD